MLQCLSQGPPKVALIYEAPNPLNPCTPHNQGCLSAAARGPDLVWPGVADSALKVPDLWFASISPKP